MRNKSALLIVLAMLLLAGLAVQAQAAERSDSASARSELTVQRLLSLRFEQVLRLVRDLDTQADVAGGSISTHTIIDEPDPAGRSGRNGGGARARHVAPNGLDDLQIHIGRGQRQFAAFGPQQDIGQDRDGVAALHHTVHMGKSLQQVLPFER